MPRPGWYSRRLRDTAVYERRAGVDCSSTRVAPQPPASGGAFLNAATRGLRFSRACTLFFSVPLPLPCISRTEKMPDLQIRGWARAMFHPTSTFLIGLPVLAYLLGSVPWGLVLTRMFTSVDIRRQGSGNIGATNVQRLAGTPLGLLTLAGDLLKGAAPVYLAVNANALDPIQQALFVSVVALAAFAGHLFPLYLKLKVGGKGVATAAGCFLVISPMSVLAALIAFLLILGWFKRVSAGSLSAAAVLPVAVWWSLRSPVFSGCAVLMAALIVLRHKENIRRLLTGSEPTISGKKKRR